MARRETPPDPLTSEPTDQTIAAAQRETFVRVLAETARVSDAAAESGVPLMRWYWLRDTDPVFAEAWHAAQEAGNDTVEDEAVRRAVAGHAEPVFYQGKQVGSVRKYSDSLLMFVLKARRPQRFRDRGDIEVASDLAALLREIGGEIGEAGREEDGRDD
ncbi:MAG: hypothetical protein HOL07_11125 [Rhodospirillaceae bacterium]|nr:hypothetical protein [Rhodospirillaceae bacterium]MBT4773658.1 hypothetical protein [Rhodospirillaceae bacterium]MBT5358887.1 hypothetical protein [Rhodospirillaceae bacterium]MBT5770168.1 hypothetical protein [Rhodospirillaceae bacterium]MBT6310944.1 hypothetical protein [Rhodospirillaceae bacterium]